MKKLLCGLVAMACAAVLAAQTDVLVITHPVLPHRDVLDRLSLEVGWHTRIKLVGGNDGLFSVQFLPSKTDPEILVQTRKGAVVLLDAETGERKWQMPLEGTVLAAAGFNTQSIFVARNNQLYVLNRKNGLHRVYAKRKGYPDPVMGYPLPATPSAPLTADGAGLFVAMGQRISSYVHPDFERALEAIEKEREKRADPTETPRPEAKQPPLDASKILIEADKLKDEAGKPKAEPGTSVQPLELWSYYTRAAAIQQAPLATYEDVNIVTSAGNFVTLDRFKGVRLFEFKTLGSVSAPMGRHGLIAYIGSDDYTLYALDLHADKIHWRFLAQGPIYRQPEVTDADVYVTADRLGMSRLVRESGEQVWLNARAERFLATNSKFVYALDRNGQLLILDALRGTTLANWDARDWTTGIGNEWTDRVYLAAQDGQIACLHHRDLPSPLRNRTMLTLRKEDKKPPEPKKEEEKKEEEKKEEKKEDKKKDDKKEEKKDVKKKEDKKIDDKKKDDKKDEKKDDKKAAEVKMGRFNVDRAPAVLARWLRPEEVPAVSDGRRERIPCRLT